MKYLIIIFTFLSLSLTSQAQHNHAFQDTLKTETGYEIDFPHVHIIVDTIHHISKIYSYYHFKAYFSINSGKGILMQRQRKKNKDDIEKNTVLTVWSEHFTLTVSKKKYREIFKL